MTTNPVLEFFQQNPNVVPVAGAVTVFLIFVMFLRGRLISAEPNEWLLVLANGKQSRAGIGLVTFLRPFESYVKFPSQLMKVEFSADQVTSEGVRISGFGVFNVNREGDGPFKFYRSTEDGEDGREENIRGVADALIRRYVSNHTLNDVLRKRSELQMEVKAEAEKLLKGWGFWLETMEITEVLISSNPLFQDMQAEYRLARATEAQRVKLAYDKEVHALRLELEETTSVAKSQKELRVSTAEQKTRTEKESMVLAASLERQNAEATHREKAIELEMRIVTADKKLADTKADVEFAKRKVAVQRELELAEMRASSEMSRRRAEIEVDKSHNSISLQKATLDTTADIYRSLPLKEMNVNNFSGPGSNLAALLPAVGSLMRQAGSA